MFSINVISEDVFGLTYNDLEFYFNVLGEVKIIKTSFGVADSSFTEKESTKLDFALIDEEQDSEITVEDLAELNSFCNENKAEILAVLEEELYEFKINEQQARIEDGYGCLW